MIEKVHAGGRRTEHRHIRLVRQDACFRDTSRVCCSSVEVAVCSGEFSTSEIVSWFATHVKKTRGGRSSQSKLWRDSKMQRTTGWTC